MIHYFGYLLGTQARTLEIASGQNAAGFMVDVRKK